MLTQAPLPTWGLLRSLWRRSASDVSLAAPWQVKGETAGWLSQSNWFLALIALWRKRRAPASLVTVWVPDYFCNASLTVLRRTGARLVFYPLTAAMTPDLAACRTLLEGQTPDAFLLVHYFGRPAQLPAVRDFCARTGAWLIEDAAHALRPTDAIGVSGDFVLYSPHKHLPIPDGAVMVVRSGGPAKFSTQEIASFGLPPSWSGQLSQLQHELAGSVRSGAAYAVVWFCKRVLQKVGVNLSRGTAEDFAEPLPSDTPTAVHLVSPAPSGLTRRLLTGLLPHLPDIARWRQRNQLLWDASLTDAHSSSTVAVTQRPAKREWTPYLGVYEAASAAIAEETYVRCRRQGLPVTTWPDLPPEVTADPSRHALAWQLRHTRFYLPVHQSLNVLDIATKSGRSGVGPEQSTPRFELAWDGLDREEWDRWTMRAGRSNPLQSWAYGAAKTDTSDWRVRRGVFYRQGEPVALVQVLEKRIAGVLRVVRVNRGPLYVQSLTPQEQFAVWRELAHLGNLRRLTLLTAAPELELSGASLTALARLGLRQFQPRAWESVWIDLGDGLDELRKSLDGKWRNMLASAEKAGLQLHVGSDDELFEWMMSHYSELMRQKSFSGPPVEFLRAWRKRLSADSQLLVLRAMAAGEPVAGLCVARHGASATYLLGWNGPKGRSLKANQYLLWQAIVQLKQAGLRWFDLGGISEDQTPGISAFKLGMNGERYELVGEYWKW